MLFINPHSYPLKGAVNICISISFGFKYNFRENPTILICFLYLCYVPANYITLISLASIFGVSVHHNFTKPSLLSPEGGCEYSHFSYKTIIKRTLGDKIIMGLPSCRLRGCLALWRAPQCWSSCLPKSHRG